MNADSYYDPPEPTAEWEADAFCSACDKDTLNLYVEWRWPGHTVTRECEKCGGVFEVEDDGR